jgi:putative peptidoglycan lipid II flippase
VLIATLCVFLLQVVLRVTASDLGEGSVSAIGFANQIAAVPVALLTTPVGTVLMPRFALEMQHGGLQAGTRLLNEAVLVVTFGSALIGALLVGLAQPITELLFQRGNFGASDSALTAEALRFLGAGLFAVSASSLLSRAFVAARRVRPLAYIWVATLAFLIASWLALRGTVDVGALAGIYSAANVFALVALLVVLRREGAGMGPLAAVGVGVRLTVSAGLAALTSWGIYELTMTANDSFLHGTYWNVARLALAASLGAAAFLATAFALRGEESAAAGQWIRLLRRRREMAA